MLLKLNSIKWSFKFSWATTSDYIPLGFVQPSSYLTLSDDATPTSCESRRFQDAFDAHKLGPKMHKKWRIGETGVMCTSNEQLLSAYWEMEKFPVHILL